jgi:hypothetical protein
MKLNMRRSWNALIFDVAKQSDEHFFHGIDIALETAFTSRPLQRLFSEALTLPRVGEDFLDSRS